MAFIGRLHPLLIHFPIALVLAAAAAEGAASITADDRWRRVAVGNVRAAGTLVAVTGHFGELLVWGANFLRP